MHKKYTFVAGSLGRFIRKNQLSFHYIEVYPEMICRKRTDPGEKFFILTLKRPGLILKLPLSQGPGVKSWPTIEQTLEMLVSDILLYIHNKTFEDFMQEMPGSEDIEDLEHEYEVLKSLTERTEKFLGEKAFQELLNLADQGFELEGDKGWRRQGTCR